MPSLCLIVPWLGVFCCIGALVYWWIKRDSLPREDSYHGEIMGWICIGVALFTGIVFPLLIFTFGLFSMYVFRGLILGILGIVFCMVFGWTGYPKADDYRPGICAALFGCFGAVLCGTLFFVFEGSLRRFPVLTPIAVLAVFVSVIVCALSAWRYWLLVREDFSLRKVLRNMGTMGQTYWFSLALFLYISLLVRSHFF